MRKVYLDWAATSPISNEVAEYIRDISLRIFGNPSSIHEWGESANILLEECRASSARLIGAAPSEVYFTAGGSEANNLVISALLHRKRPGHIVTSALEHSSVYEPTRMLEAFGWKVTRVAAGVNGVVTPESVEKALKSDTELVAVMLVNNETGAIQPIREITEKVRGYTGGKRRIHIHTDAVQAVGKIPVDFAALGVDSLSVSAHKFRGPRGVGLLVASMPPRPVYRGGGQEGGLRPGTENVAGIAGMTKALEAAAVDLEENLRKMRETMDVFLHGFTKCKSCLVLPAGRIGSSESFSPYIATLSFPPLPGEVLVRIMSDKGFGISTGSACSSRKKRDTRVLEGSGVSRDLSFSSLRVSLGPDTRSRDVEEFRTALLRETEILFRVAK